MTLKKFSILTSIIVTSAILGFSVMDNPAYADTCPSSVTVNTVLTADCDGSISIDADNITLDCAGHSITGTGSGSGILLLERNGVTVQNCNVSNFRNGFEIRGSSNNIFDENTANNNRSKGFYFVSLSDNNTLSKNTANGNGGLGFEFLGSSNNMISENTANNNRSKGFYFVSLSDNNTLSKNTANRNGVSGFEFLGSSNNMISENTANGNEGTRNTLGGFVFNRSDSNTIYGNTANNNNSQGFEFRSSENNTINENTANKNHRNGFHLNPNSVGNELSNNQASKNTEFGYYDDSFGGSGTGITDNTYTDNKCNKNTLGGSSPSGLCGPQV